MNLSKHVSNNAGTKAYNDVDEAEMNGDTSKLMTSGTAENVDVKRDEKRTRHKKSRDKKPKMFSISDVVMQSIETLKDPEGVTVENILNYIQSRYKVNKHLMKRNVVRFLETSVEKGVLESASGTGDVARFKIKQIYIVKRDGKQMNKTPKMKKLFDADTPHYKKADIEKIEQRMKMKKPHVEEDEQQFKIKKTDVVEKKELQFKTKQTIKKGGLKLKGKKTKENAQRLKKSDNVKKGKRQSKIKKTEGKDGRHVKKSDVIKKESVKKPKRKNTKK